MLLLEGFDRRTGPIAEATYEELTAFEYERVLLPQSVAAWHRMLAAWRVVPNDTIIATVLASRTSSRRRNAHSETIYNAAEVRAALKRAPSTVKYS